MLPVQTAVVPFDLSARKTRAVPLGSNVEEIVRDLMPVYLEGVDVYVTINGEVINPDHWTKIKPKSNAIVSVNYVPAGGKKKGKNPLATVISIVTLVAAPYLAATYGAALGTALNVSTQLASGIIRVAVGAVGFLASSALSSPPSQPNTNNGSREASVRESPTQFVEGSTNRINQWGVVPINLGVNRMFPPQCALPFTESSGDDQFSRQLFTWGFGEVELSEIKIGETEISDFEEVITQDRLDANLDAGISLYTNDVFQEELNVTLEPQGSFNLRTTQLAIDEIEVDVTMPQGLVSFNDRGNRRNATINVEVRFRPTGGGAWDLHQFTVTGATTSALRRTFRFGVATGQYDVEVRRTDNTVGDRIRSATTWTALRSIKRAPPVLQSDISGTAMRIRATDQLNGSVDRFNAVVGTKILDWNGTTWVKRVSSNPASIYRHVLQSPAFVKRLPDSRINLNALQQWHDYCASLGLEYNRVIDFETNMETVLNDIAAAGFASKHNVDGIYSIIVDNERPLIKGMVTPKNSWGYKGQIAYPEIPHGLIIEFRNPDRNYALDERIIYDEGFNETNASLYERIEFPSCTDKNLAFIYGRRYLANMRLQPENHTFFQDPEFLSVNRGDRITFVHDAILVGVGSGRIKSVIYDDDITPTQITGFVIDDVAVIPSTDNFAVRIRYSDATDFAYHNLSTAIGETDTFTFTTPVNLSLENSLLDGLCSFVEDGKELDLIVTSVEFDPEYNAKITAINYAPERFDLDGQAIPSFQSNVTIPLGSYRPEPPELGNGPIQSDESVMIPNSDGSLISRMIIPLSNLNEADVETLVKFRRSGETQFYPAEVLSVDPKQIILTGLDDDSLYDFQIRYQRRTGQGLISAPLILNNILNIGAGTEPSDVEGFTISIANDDVATLAWGRNNDIDISHYEVRFSPVFSNAVWETSQLLEEFVYENRLTIAFRGGTYLIKAVDIAGNQSVNATAIITLDPGQIKNVVELLREDPTFNGVKTNCQLDTGTLVLIDNSLDGVYEFENSVDLGDVQNSFLSAEVNAGAVSSVDNGDLFSEDDIFAMEDIFGIGGGQTSVVLESRFTDDDPSATPNWTDWMTFTSGFRSFRGAEFRVRMQSFSVSVSPVVIGLSVTVDMPDRIERGEDLNVPAAGVTITHSPAFQNNPAVNITIQDGDAADRIEFVSKSSGGFTFRVYNETSATYVARSFDFIASGFGRRS